MKFGIDISTWQGGMNLNQAKKEGVEFAILRAGFTGSGNGISKAIDNQFETFYKGAKENGLGVGAYWFSRATTYENGKAEAEYMYENCLKGKQFDYPIYIDVEDSHYQSKAGKDAVTSAIKGFCEYLESKGYYVGIYANTNWFRNYMNLSELTMYDKWIASWGTERPSIDGGMWQFGGETNLIRSNKIAGMTCDQNYAYKDYPSLIKNNGLNGFTKGEEVKPKEEPKEEPTKFSIGDKVVINGDLYVTSDTNEPSGSVKNKTTKITRIAKGTKHPYNTTGDLGWMSESSIKLYSKKTPQVTNTIKKGDKVKVLKNITFEGKKFIKWFSKYDVIEVNNNRVVIGKGKIVTCAININNIKKI